MTTGVQDQQPPPPAKVVERLNPAVQQQLNLDSVKTRAISLFKAISRILEEFDVIARTNAVPKWYTTCLFESIDFIYLSSTKDQKLYLLNLGNIWGFSVCRQDILGQFSMVNLELYNIVEDTKNVSKAFVVHPKNVNAENATSMLPVPTLIKILFSIWCTIWKSNIFHLQWFTGIKLHNASVWQASANRILFKMF